MRLLNWIPALAFAAAIFFFSHQTDPAGAGAAPDYVLHFLAYAAFSCTVLWGLTNGIREALSPRITFLAWLLSTAYGALDEFHQSFIPGRTATIVDFVADSAGAAVALLSVWCIWRLGGLDCLERK